MVFRKVVTNFEQQIARYEMFIVVGILMTIGTLLKLVWNYNIDSDWFWFLAGVGLVVEGSISYVKQRRFERKFKIIDREEYENLMKKK